MLLAIDVGNTATKVFHGSRIGRVLSATTLITGETERLEGEDQPWLAEVLAKCRKAEYCAIASVVPKLRSTLHNLLTEAGLPFRFLEGSIAPGLAVKYDTPETLGADRLANALYLQEHAKLPAVCVDFGTATKLDVVDGTGAYLGGAILPGVQMMIDSLNRGTAQLPKIEIGAPTRAIGRSTKECLQSGTVLALAMAVEGLLGAFALELAASESSIVNRQSSIAESIHNPQVLCHPERSRRATIDTVLATGGHAAKLAPLCPSIQRIEPNLTLEGLLVAAKRWLQEGR